MTMESKEKKRSNNYLFNTWVFQGSKVLKF